jgi:signal transduction histidine kinase
VVCTDLNFDPRLTRRELVRQMGWASALIVPLVVRADTPRGAFAVYTTEPRHFSDWDVRLLTCLANYAAVALQQAEALEQLKLARERQAVAETFAVLGDVAANLLHRVNNLVGVIPVRVQGIMDKCAATRTDAYLSAGLQEIEESARAAMATARETMTYLRPLRLQPVSVADCYRMAIMRLAVPPHIQLSATGLEDLPPVWAGVEQLRLVLSNLIENALDALGERPGRVTVSGWYAPGARGQGQPWVEISVADDGPGVSAEFRERIFDPEFSTKRSPKKMGFGLWWVKSWVQRFGGRIELTPPHAPAAASDLRSAEVPEDGGCVFLIQLPPAPGGA